MRKKLLDDVRDGIVRSRRGWQWEADNGDLEHLRKVLSSAFQDSLDFKFDCLSS